MSDVTLSDAERERVEHRLAVVLSRARCRQVHAQTNWGRCVHCISWAKTIGAPALSDVMVDTVEAILAARLSQEREQARAERDREWRAWCAAMQDEWRAALHDGVLSPGLRRAADDLDRDWSRQMVERRGRESFAQDGPGITAPGKHATQEVPDERR